MPERFPSRRFEDLTLLISKVGFNWVFTVMIDAPLLFAILLIVIPRLKRAEEREVIDDTVSHWPISWRPSAGGSFLPLEVRVGRDVGRRAAFAASEAPRSPIS